MVDLGHGLDCDFGNSVENNMRKMEKSIRQQEKELQMQKIILEKQKTLLDNFNYYQANTTVKNEKCQRQG